MTLLPSLPLLADYATDGAGWRSHAAALARFFERFANRRDAWGGYWPVDIRSTYGKVRTRPSKSRRGLELLDVRVLFDHFIGADEGDVVGLHATAPDGLSRWCGMDFDAHEDAEGNPPTPARLEQLRDATLWCTDVLGERLSVLVEDSDGAGGFHLWAYFDAPVVTASLYAWLQQIATRCAEATTIRPETFPKQATIPRGGFGSWLRLPGRHHTHPHWSRVSRPGEDWSRGSAAAMTILHRWPASPADAVPLLEAAPITEGVATDRAPIEGWRLVTSLRDTPRDRASVIAAYVRRLPHGEAGTERSNKLFSLARFLRHGMQCTEAEALPILHAWDAGNRPPLGAAKVASTWANAALYAARPVGLKVQEGVRYAA